MPDAGEVDLQTLRFPGDSRVSCGDGNMESQKLNDWLQVVGAGGIIASLVFVGVQLKQTQEIAIAAQYQARHESIVETLRSFIQSDTALRLYGNQLAQFLQQRPDVSAEIRALVSQQPVEELALLSLGAQIDLKSADNLYYQFQSGFLTEESWLGFREELKFALAQQPPASAMRAVYTDTRMMQRESFREFVDDLIAEIDSAAR